MKEEIIDGKYRLIKRLEEKINQLNQQRAQMSKPIQIKQIYRDSDIKYDDNKSKLSQLQALYQHKKQLERLGIVENDPQKILQYVNQPYIQERIDRYKQTENNNNAVYINKNKKNQEKNKQKQQILSEQMKKVQAFLKKKKATKKQIQQLQQLNYKILLAESKNKLKQFENLLNKKNTLLEKQELLQKIFDMIKFRNNSVQKLKLSQFLLANPTIARKFYITQRQIYRDLQVYETQDKDILTFQQFYQFIKSIQLTNPQLNPNLKKRPSTANKTDKKQIKSQTLIKKPISDINVKRYLEKYLAKLFIFLDRKNEKIIIRDVLINSLKQNLLLKHNNAKNIYHLDTDQTVIINIQISSKIADRIEQNKKKMVKKSYYKQLQSKYVSMEQILDAMKSVLRGQEQRQKQQQNKNNSMNLLSNIIRNNKQPETVQQAIFFIGKNHIKEKQQQKQTQLQQKQQQKQKYPWEIFNKKHNIVQESEQTDNPAKQLKALDKYYSNLRNEHANEIQWGRLGQQNQIQKYQQKELLKQFKNLQQYIKQEQYMKLQRR